MKKFLLLAFVWALVLSGCPNGDGGVNLLVGTWANPAYDGLGGSPPYKIVFKGDGTLEVYYDIASATPEETGTYTFAFAAFLPGTIDFLSNLSTISFNIE